jgi:hypothetical protein
MSQIHWQPGITLEEIEKQVILAALRFYSQNRTHAASALGISVRTIQNKIAKYNGEPVEEDDGVYEEQSKSDVAAAGVQMESSAKFPSKRRLSVR